MPNRFQNIFHGRKSETPETDSLWVRIRVPEDGADIGSISYLKTLPIEGLFFMMCHYEESAQAAIADLKLASHRGEDGRTVAHIAAFWHESVAREIMTNPKMERIAKLKDKYGWTVAHESVWAHTPVAQEFLRNPAMPQLADLVGWRCLTVEWAAKRSSERTEDGNAAKLRK
jgi:hypothetical protein